MNNLGRKNVLINRPIKLLLFIAILTASIFLAVGCNKANNNTDETPHSHTYVLDSLLIEHSEISNCGKFVCSGCEEMLYRTITPEDVGVPILNFNGSMDGISKDNKITLSVSYESEDKAFESDATLKWQGSSSLAYDKKNYNIQFLQEGTSKKNKIEIKEEWGKQSKYTLKANYIDFSHARNIVSGKIYNQIVKTRDIDDVVGNLATGGVVDGYPILIYHNGNYHGLYTLNIPKDNWMFGMDDDEEDDNIVTKQAVLAGDNWSDEAYLRQETVNGSGAFELEYCSTEDTIGTDWVWDSFNNMVRFINNSSDEEFLENIDNYIDIDRTIDSMIYTSVIMAGDNVAKNIIWLTYDGEHWFSSVYDMDGSWGLFWDGKSYYEPNIDIVSETLGNNLWKRIYKLYETEIAKRYLELRINVLNINNIKKEFETFDSQISAIMRTVEVAKWSEIPSQATNNIAQILDFAEKRLAYLDAKMFKFEE